VTDIEDSRFVADAPEDRTMECLADLREALGSEVVVHFTVEAPVVVTEDTRELAVDVGTESEEGLERRANEGRSAFVARLNPRTQARPGQPIRLTVDTARLNFFDPETSAGLYGD
jgi:multiple sugar transport system ATP-binding protein